MSATAVQPVEAVPAEALGNNTNPVDEVIVVPAEAAPAAPAASHAETSDDKPTETTEKDKVEETVVAASDEKKEEKPVPHEITHGTLSKNSHGALLSFFKQKRFFYFQDDPIPEENLRLYMYKDSAMKSHAAYATQTGKGLWFYTKDESRKELPHGIIKLADVTDVVENGTKQFVLKMSTGDLHFEASPVERDNWVFTLKAKIEEAKAAAESVTESESYKLALEKLTKHTVTTSKPAEKTEDSKVTDAAKAEEPAAEKNEPAAEPNVMSDEEAGPSESKDVKRTTSKKGKRTSKFSDFFGKKEKVDDKEADSKDDKDKSVEVSDSTVTPVVGETPAAVTEDKKTEVDSKAAEEAPVEKGRATLPVKRHSFFRVFEKKAESSGEKQDKEVAEAAKDVSATENADGEGKVEESPAAASEEKTTTPVTVGTASPPKTKFLALLGKRDKSPGPKTPEEKVETSTEQKPITPPAETPACEPVAGQEIAVEIPKEGTAADSSGEAASPATKEKRKSFFSFKKEKKSDDVKSDSEEATTEATTPKTSTSPVPKGLSLTSLKRKVSRAGKGKETETKDVVSPPTVAEEVETKETPVALKTAEPVEAAPIVLASESKPEVVPAAPVIGDVVPDAVTVGQSRPVHAAA